MNIETVNTQSRIPAPVVCEASGQQYWRIEMFRAGAWVKNDRGTVMQIIEHNRTRRMATVQIVGESAPVNRPFSCECYPATALDIERAQMRTEWVESNQSKLKRIARKRDRDQLPKAPPRSTKSAEPKTAEQKRAIALKAWETMRARKAAKGTV